jgi:hypothetical protein
LVDRKPFAVDAGAAIDKKRRALHHPPRPAARAKATAMARFPPFQA